MMNRANATDSGYATRLLESRGLFIAMVLLGVASRLLLTLFTPFWLDELWSSAFSNPGLDLATVISRTIADVHPPLYQILLYGWFQFFGFSEPAGRLLSLLAGLAAIPLFYLLAGAVYSARTARISTMLFALSPLAVGFSSEVRSYELLLLLAILSSYCLVLIFRQQRPAGYIGYFLSALAIAYTHYFGIILLFCHFISVAILAARSHDWKTTTSILVIYLLLLLSYLPMLQAVSANLARTDFWIKNPGFLELAMYIPLYFSGPLAIPLFIFLGWLGYRNRPQLGLREGLLALATLIILVLPWLLGFFISPVITLRNVIIYLPCITLLIGHITTLATPRQALAIIIYSVVILGAAIGYSVINKGEHLDRMLTAVKENPAPLYFPTTESWTVEYFVTKIELNARKYGEIHPLILEDKERPMPEVYWLACYHKCYKFSLEEWVPSSHTIKLQVQGRGVKAYLLERKQPATMATPGP